MSFVVTFITINNEIDHIIFNLELNISLIFC